MLQDNYLFSKKEKVTQSYTEVAQSYTEKM